MPRRRRIGGGTPCGALPPSPRWLHVVFVLLVLPLDSAAAPPPHSSRSLARLLSGARLSSRASDRSSWLVWRHRAVLAGASDGRLWGDGVTPYFAANWTASRCAVKGPFGSARAPKFVPLDGKAAPRLECRARTPCTHAMATADWKQSCEAATVRAVLSDDGEDAQRSRAGGDNTRCGEAFVALLGDDGYLPGVVALVTSIRAHALTARDVVVLAGPKVSRRVCNYLVRTLCVHVRTYDVDVTPPCSRRLEAARDAGRRHCNSARMSGVMSKLLAFALTEYCRVAIVDADIWFFDNPEAALWPPAVRGGGRKAVYAAPRFRANHAFFGSHLLNVIPDASFFRHLLELLGDERTVVPLLAQWGFSEQEFLNIALGSCRSANDGTPLGAWGRLPHAAVPNVNAVSPSLALVLKSRLRSRRRRRRTRGGAIPIVGLHANAHKPWRDGWLHAANGALLAHWWPVYKSAPPLKL